MPGRSRNSSPMAGNAVATARLSKSTRNDALASSSAVIHGRLGPTRCSYPRSADFHPDLVQHTLELVVVGEGTLAADAERDAVTDRQVGRDGGGAAGVPVHEDGEAGAGAAAPPRVPAGGGGPPPGC